MLKVLLVDDEPFIRQGLAALIDWEQEGFQIVAGASNGIEALEILKKEKMDLIIADIKMPKMNGIELLEEIRRTKVSQAKFVILSGYFEFGDAKTAIQCNCADYILKPVQKEELKKVLQKIAKENKEEKINNEEDNKKEKALLERNVLSLIWNKFDDINLKQVKRSINPRGKIRYINIELDILDEAYSGLAEMEKRHRQRELYSKVCMAMGTNSGHVIFDVTKQEDCYDVGLIYCDYFAKENNMTEREHIEWLVNSISNQIATKLLVHVGNQVEEIEKISESYKTATIAKSFQIFRNDKDVSYYEETILKNNDIGTGIEKQKLDDLIRSIECNDEAKIKTDVDKIYQAINSGNMDYQLINLNIDYILYHLIHLATEQDGNVNQEEVITYISANAFDNGARRGSNPHFKQFAIEYARYLAQLRGNTSRGVLGDVEREIEEHYYENMSLKTLGEKYYINSAYLGQLFKKKYAQSFKDYLNNYRIEKAVEQLLRTDEKVYLIAEKVGYHNLDYFITKFVSLKGCTPTKYRKTAKISAK